MSQGQKGRVMGHWRVACKPRATLRTDPDRLTPLAGRVLAVCSVLLVRPTSKCCLLAVATCVNISRVSLQRKPYPEFPPYPFQPWPGPSSRQFRKHVLPTDPADGIAFTSFAVNIVSHDRGESHVSCNSRLCCDRGCVPVSSHSLATLLHGSCPRAKRNVATAAVRGLVLEQ